MATLLKVPPMFFPRTCRNETKTQDVGERGEKEMNTRGGSK